MSTQAEPSEVIREQLDMDEQLLWAGQPRAGLRLQTSDLLMVPFSLMWGGFAFFWEWQVIKTGAPLFMMLWGIPFVLIGLYMIVGRFFWDAYRRGTTFYGITTQRAIIVTRSLAGTTRAKSMQLRSMSDVTLSADRDGSGSIQLGPSANTSAAWWAGAGWPGAQGTSPSFEQLPDAKSVYAVLQRAQREAR